MERLRRVCTSVEVTGGREIGSAEAPGLTRTPAVTAVVGGVARALVQSQVYLSMPDVADPRRRAVTRLVLTATKTSSPMSWTTSGTS
ncbi:hypothetical protein ACIRBX_26555 [Kitasatospora sp. NPDC096147]|uniref:hypothetical protein n=1 Tax=Kitasatospora sp. NPDC096147 TaxID=3364093 RepID=UPI0037FE48DD